MRKVIAWFFLVFVASSPGLAATENLAGVQITHCAQKFCYKLISDRAQRGVLDSLFAFSTAELKVFDRANGQEVSLHGKGGYYDPKSQYIVLRNIEDRPFSEVLINLQKDRLTVF